MPHRRSALGGALALVLALTPLTPAGAHPESDAEGEGPPSGGTETSEQSESAESAETHRIEFGETLWLLARRFHLTVQTLAAVNDIADPDRIVAGDELVVPTTGEAGGSSPSGPTPSPASRGTHVVQPGETLSSIAARHGLPVDALAAANGLVDRDTVWVGSRLILAADAPALPEPEGAATHVVQPGETLSEIAVAYGTTVGDLVAANGLDDPDRVVAGTSLSVPGSWHCPAPSVTRMVNDFGAPRHGGRFHDGIDLFAPRGDPVVAPVSGVVEQTEGRRGGRQFRLVGDDGHTYIGTHLDTFGAAGRVSGGEVLGTVGTTGNAAGTDPHLHFEMHATDGPVVNPYPALTRACGV